MDVIFLCTHRLKEEGTNKILKYKFYTNTKQTLIADAEAVKKKIFELGSACYKKEAKVNTVNLNDEYTKLRVIALGGRYFVNLTLTTDNRLLIKDCPRFLPQGVQDIYQKAEKTVETPKPAIQKPVEAPKPVETPKPVVQAAPVQAQQPAPVPVQKPVEAPKPVVQTAKSEDCIFGPELDKKFNALTAKPDYTAAVGRDFLTKILSIKKNAMMLIKANDITLNQIAKGIDKDTIFNNIVGACKCEILAYFIIDDELHREVFPYANATLNS